MNRSVAPFCCVFFAALLIGALTLAAPVGASSPFTTLYNFSAESGVTRTDGAFPSNGPLVQGLDGNFYGTTAGGGTSDEGTIFKITPSGTLTTLASFNRTNGANPYGGLVQGTDGNFYGMTDGGGANSTGTVFKMTPTGTLTTLHSFASVNGNFVNADGAFPLTGLVQGSDGNFYGMAYRGGASGSGTVFKMTPTGMLTTLVSFTGQNGAYPFSSLIQGSDGSFYGTTQQGGSDSNGTVFKMTPAGALTILHSFGDGSVPNDGIYPEAAVVQGSDGSFYGTANGGGSDSVGTVYKITSTGAFARLASFRFINGEYPSCSLIAGRDGNFYGTTQEGGASNDGTAFRVTPSGVLTELISFDGMDGSLPEAGLLLGPDGSLYGTTSQGGTSSQGGEGGTGTVFRLTITTALPPTLTGFTPGEGPIYSTVTLIGTNLGNLDVVRFHDASALQFTANADGTQLSVMVPSGAEKGAVTVSNAAGSATTSAPFRITYAPVITFFTPASGPAGTVVTITGTHLTGITRVRFHNADSTVYSSNADGTQLTVTVPSGAATGTITLDNRDALATTSTGVFTVTP